MKNSKILQVVGYSSSGKTTFISYLIKLLKEQEIKIISIKSARNHKYDLSKKDSDIFLESGSDFSVVVFKNSTQITSSKPIDLAEIIEQSKLIIKPDLILIEGFKEEKYPKILLWSREFAEHSEMIDYSDLLYVYVSIEDYQEYYKKITEFMEKTDAILENDINKLVKRIVKDFRYEV